MPGPKRLLALVVLASGIAGGGILGVWIFLRCQWTAPTPPAPADEAVAAVSPTHIQALPVTTEAQVADLKKRLKESGIQETCCFKCGQNFSGHSLVGRFENVDFRIMFDYRTGGAGMPPAISVYLNADGPSLKEAEGASRRLLAKLETKP